jgi:hypothetical protein
MFAEDARLSRLVLRLTQHSKLLEAGMFAHFIAEVFGSRTAARRGGEPNVLTDLRHEAPHPAQRSKPPGAFQRLASPSSGHVALAPRSAKLL